MRFVVSLVVAALLSLIGVELVSYEYLSNKTKMEPYPLFFDGEFKRKNSYTLNPYSGLDPLLGYSQHKRIRGNLKKYGMYRKTGQGAWHVNKTTNCVSLERNCVFNGRGPVIAALGGSTTDAYAAIRNKRHPWTTSFSKKCREQYASCEVHNLGVGGFGSAQETIKIIRDIATQKYTHVIALHGPNELNRLRDRHLTTVNAKLYKELFDDSRVDGPYFPNTKAAYLHFTKGVDTPAHGQIIFYGNSSKISDFEHWKTNVKLSRGALREVGIDYYVVLQPIIGFGDYRSPNLVQEGKKSQKYFQRVREFYEQASEFCRSVMYCIDLSNMYAGNSSELFTDPRHPNDLGNELIGKAIYEKIRPNI